MSSIINKIKDILQKKPPTFELDNEIKRELVGLVKENMKQYREKYNHYFVKITKKLEEEQREFDFDKVDKEAKRRAGGDTIKDDVTEIVAPQVLSKVEKDFPEDEKQRKLTEIAAKKTIERTIGSAVDRIVEMDTEKMKEETAEEKKDENSGST